MDKRIEKLPVWAKELITDLNRQRLEAVNALRRYMDNQTVSPFRFVDTLSLGLVEAVEQSDAVTLVVRYVDTHRMTIVNSGVLLDITVPLDRPGLELKWGDDSGHNYTGGREVALIPTSFQSARIVHPKDMR